MHLPALALSSLLLASTSAYAKITNLVTFGDSYTDQSRLTAFYTNGSIPAHYQEVYPPGAYAANGGSTWVKYAEEFGGLETWNYAVSGASCSNLLTPRHDLGAPKATSGVFPSVSEYEISAFLTDHLVNTTYGGWALDLDPEETIYSLWIGTNDLGVDSLLTGNQIPGVTLVNTTACALNVFRTLYQYGARKFLLMNMIPLQLTPLYSRDATNSRYWKNEFNATSWNIFMTELVTSGNELWRLGAPALAHELKGAEVGLFDSYGLFWDMYHEPEAYGLDNVTGWVAHCPVSGSGNCSYAVSDYKTNGNQDRFLWFDELHPSEPAEKIVAREVVNAIKGSGRITTWF
ncbi:GDSL lipase/acylhydrolase family protein [Saitoella complicata NRRL Y-17804]|uniref:GDSL lipase/acylhydrolase family protein n=1 Tax=Saitoella complicata (strain BCRC 22490 / CBS 7301 / JCM 7358 / NBRC 10748 / NRRL Y-17804) TaxID=698492 RepID=UPI000867CC6F|nr:GDSL lipase/acylhydrolase family protein [Saitoella complicata NRRL Y-17804]ODQ56248.1 GDSL lipase/acylhydrolase family protein [Saitoella complicata NRRL Y-17804]